jgi:hypothetical protein
LDLKFLPRAGVLSEHRSSRGSVIPWGGEPTGGRCSEMRDFPHAEYARLRTLEPGIPQEVKRQAKIGDIDPKEVAKALNLDSLTYDRPQYLPAYALQ